MWCIPTEKGRLDPVERDEHAVQQRRHLLHNVDGSPQQKSAQRPKPRPLAPTRASPDLDLGQGLPTSDVREQCPGSRKRKLRAASSAPAPPAANLSDRRPSLGG